METIQSIELVSIATNRSFDLSNPGSPMVLIFHGQDNADAAKTVNERIRSRYKKTSEVIVASVIDLGWVPRMFRKMAQKKMIAAYKQAAARLPAEYPPDKYLILLPDWDGKTPEILGFHDTGRDAAVVVLDSNGEILQKAQINGEITTVDELAFSALTAVEKLFS